MNRALLAAALIFTALLSPLHARAEAKDAKGAEQAPAETKPAGNRRDVRIGAALEYAAGRGGFRIATSPYFSRLDFPLQGVSLRVFASVAPVPGETRFRLRLEAASNPRQQGTTQDTDWAGSEKWLYSRSDTEGWNARLDAGAAWRLVDHAPARLDVRASVFFAEDVWRMSDLRQQNLIPDLTSPPGEPYTYVDGPVASYRLWTASLAIGAALDIALHEAVHVKLRADLFPFSYAEGIGDWKLRKYTFQQYGFSVFSSHRLGLQLAVSLPGGGSAWIGANRMDWMAWVCWEDGWYEASPENNYRNADIVDWMRHRRYGAELGVSWSF